MTTTRLPTRERTPAGIVPYPGPPPLPAPPPPDRTPARPGARARVRALAAPAAGLVAIAALVPARELWPARLLLLGLLLVVPGVVLLRAIGAPQRAVAATPVYVPAASLAVLMAAGAAMNFAGPPLGVATPLRTVPLLIAVEALCGLLLLASAIRVPSPPARSRILPPRISELWPLLLPLAAAAGASRLTNGDGATVAIAAVAAAVVVLLASVVAAPRLDTRRLALIVFSVGLALAWSFSLRSGTVFGFDISGELPIADLTAETGSWSLAHPGDAYGAMLSLTILPSVLQSLTGISALVLLKAVYPAIFALFPVAVFLLARRHLPARFALAAAAFVIVQANFAQQLPAVARQEIGLVVFAVLVAAAVDRRLPRGPRTALVGVLGLTLVVSHYSTTYLAIVLLAVAVVLQLLVGVVRRPRMAGGIVTALLVTAAGAALWYGPLMTDSAGNVTRFTDSVRADGLQLLPNRAEGEGILQTYLTGNAPSSATPAEYERIAREDYAKNRPFVIPLPEAGDPRYALQEAAAAQGPERSPAVRTALDRAQLVVLQLANVLAVLGALVLVLRRRTPPALRAVALLGLGVVAALALVRLSGTVSESYNQDRALIQALVPLAVGLAWTAHWAWRRTGRLRPVVVGAVTLALGVVAVSTSGLAGVALDRPTFNLADTGEDVERYYVSGPELASAQWLRAARYRGGPVYTDRYGQLRLISERVPTEGLFLDITPATLDQHAWIYATEVNTVDGRARAANGNRFTTYRFPDRFIGDNWNTVYANGSSEVFHR